MYAVLFVDDEINILNSLKRGLIDEDYECVFASSGKEALDIMEKKNFSVIVTDMRMPSMDGLTLLKEVKRMYPKTVRIVLSGYTQLQQILITINQADIFKFITKPWKLEEEFKYVIKQAIDYYHLQVENDEMKKALENKNTAYKNILKNIDEVVASAKKESQYIKDVGNFVFRFLSDNISEKLQVEELIERVQLCKKLCLNYFRINTEIKEIDLNDFLDEINLLIKSFKGISKIDWLRSLKIPLKVKISTDIINFVVLTLLESLVFEEGRYYIKLIDEVKETSKESLTLEISVLISGLAENNTAYLKNKISEGIDFRMEFLKGLLNEILKPYHGSFAITKVDINIVAKFQINIKNIS